jgi:hypothetical protein
MRTSKADASARPSATGHSASPHPGNRPPNPGAYPISFPASHAFRRRSRTSGSSMYRPHKAAPIEASVASPFAYAGLKVSAQ